MKILVTGASGYLGTVLCRSLVKNHEVAALALDASDAKSLENLNIKKIDADIRDQEKMDLYFQNQDIIFHLANLIRITPDSDKLMHAVNVEGTRIVAEAALKNSVKKFIHVSSIHALSGYPKNEIINETRELALSPKNLDYDRTKAEAECELQKVIAKGLNAIIINPTCFIGPYDFEPSLMGKAVKDMFKHKIAWFLPGGFNYVDVRDVALTLIESIDKGEKGERYIVAGEWISNRILADYIFKARGFQGLKIQLPLFVAHIFVKILMTYWSLKNKKVWYSNQSIRHLKFHREIDDSKARKFLYHKSRPLMQTFADLKTWYEAPEF